MPEFTRACAPGGTFFFTLVTYDRLPIFRSTTARRLLRDAIREVRTIKPLDVDAIVLLPDHLHCIWTLPPGDTDFSIRWRKIKEFFTRSWLASGAKERETTTGQRRKGLRGVWQQRFWEHTIRDERDFRSHVDYIHFNPVKHGHALCAHAWPWSSFQRWCALKYYDPHWCCACQSAYKPPDFTELDSSAIE